MSAAANYKPGVYINSYAVVPATLLDYEPPKKTSQLDNWRLNQRTQINWMSNAKLVAECYHTDEYMGDHWGGSLSTEAAAETGKFSPGQTCTQAQILTFLWRTKGSPEPTGTAALPGVDESAYITTKLFCWSPEVLTILLA